MSKPFCGSGSLPESGSAVLRPYLVGITGSRATGKSVVGEILQERHGVQVIDTDHITHELLAGPNEAYHAVLAHFGEDLVTAKDGPIDRQLLGARAFASDEAKACLEAIMFPRINERLEARIGASQVAGSKIVFVLVPLLHEAGMKEHFDEVWCVVASEKVRLARLMQRDGVTQAEAERLISKQMSQTQKAKLSDHLIDNSFDIETTAGKVKELFDAVSERAEKHAATAPAPSKVDETGDGNDSGDQPADAPTAPEVPPTAEEPPAPPTEETDGDEPPAEPDGDAPPTEPQDADANARYRKYLRTAAEIGADETLAKLGDVAGTQHQEATAHLTLSIDRKTDGGEELGRQFDVEVKMTARNKPGKAPAPGSCSCGCGDRCRVDCACQPDCGCGCKKPSPPPPPPPVEGDNCEKHRDNSRIWMLFGLLGFLAFLFACLMLWKWHDHTHVNGGTTQVTVINNVPCPGDCKPVEPPVVPPPVVVPPGPFNPPAQPPVASCGGKQELDEVPGFAFRFVHNAVRVQVARWEVTYGADCLQAKVAGFDADKRLVVYQEYDSHQYMTFQLVMSYFRDGTTQVDRFEGRSNTFTGRSIYRVNTTGSVVRAEHYTGLSRLVYVVTFVRNENGTPIVLNVEQFDPKTGSPVIKRTVDGKDSALEFMRTKFYAYDWFGQP
jgi:dephospho-CoA kinase